MISNSILSARSLRTSALVLLMSSPALACLQVPVELSAGWLPGKTLRVQKDPVMEDHIYHRLYLWESKSQKDNYLAFNQESKEWMYYQSNGTAVPVAALTKKDGQVPLFENKAMMSIGPNDGALIISENTPSRSKKSLVFKETVGEFKQGTLTIQAMSSPFVTTSKIKSVASDDVLPRSLSSGAGSGRQQPINLDKKGSFKSPLCGPAVEEKAASSEQIMDQTLE